MSDPGHNLDNMDSTLACLAAWMPRQRWYAAKGRSPSLRLVSWWDPPASATSSDTGARVRTFLVADEGALPVVLYQIPVVARATATVTASVDHIIGSPEPGTTFIDGPFDPAYTEALIRLVTAGGQGVGPGTTATGAPTRGAASAAERTSAVLSGEQSNTSVIYRSADGSTPIICKIFRQLHPGLNPDIELQTALDNAGSAYVPRCVGSLNAQWPDSATAHGTVSGSLAFAQEFLPDVEDAWRVALRAAASGEDFRGAAYALGRATAEVHRSLADLCPTRPTEPADREATLASWMRRLTMAIAEIPAIADRRVSIEAVYSRALQASWPPLQRIHGDYHLGQVLQVAGRGWVLLDFEGEPLRPMSERTLPDFALRDVAGMLRSFDYVAGSIRLERTGAAADDVREWAEAARTAFVDGYAPATEGGATPSDATLDLLDPFLAALELDKAIYEAIYESRNRPTWVTIPLRAITRLAEHAAP